MFSVPPPHRLSRWIAAAAAVACLGLISPLAHAGPSKDESPVTKEQLEYSKQLFGEGEKAMKQKDFTTAQAKYTEAYRYAPHLHLFTYNIAAAAEAAGDCRSAHYYYGQFLALVPEHPEREKVVEKVEGLKKTCPIEVAEDGEMVTKTREERDQDKAERERTRAMNEALASLQDGQQMYEAGKKRFKDSKAFKWAAWRKKRHAKKMKKVLANHGVEIETPQSSTPALPDTLGAACKTAKTQEKRTIDALEKVLEVWDTQDAYRSVSRILRGAQNKDLPRFEDCAR